MRLLQSYTPYRTQQRPVVTSVSTAEYTHVGAACCELLLLQPVLLSCSPCWWPGGVLLPMCASVAGAAHATVHATAHAAGPRKGLTQLFPLTQARLEELHRLWDLLLQKTKEKGMRLLQAQKLVQYLRECEDAMDWISDKVRGGSQTPARAVLE